MRCISIVVDSAVAICMRTECKRTLIRRHSLSCVNNFASSRRIVEGEPNLNHADFYFVLEF